MLQFVFYHTCKRFLRLVTYLQLQQNLSKCIRNLIESDKQTSSGYFILIIRIGYKDIIMRHQPAITVDPPKIGIVQYILRFSGRIGRIVAIVCPYGNHILTVPVQYICHIDYDRQVTSVMFRQQFTVYEDFTFPHDRFKMQEEFLSFQSYIGCKMLTIPHFPLIVNATACLCREVFNTVRQRYDCPVFIIKLFRIRPLSSPFIKSPCRIHGINVTSGVFHPEETGC